MRTWIVSYRNMYQTWLFRAKHISYMYKDFCKHLPVVDTGSEQKCLQRCVTTNLKANNTLMYIFCDKFNEIYSRWSVVRIQHRMRTNLYRFPIHPEGLHVGQFNTIMWNHRPGRMDTSYVLQNIVTCHPTSDTSVTCIGVFLLTPTCHVSGYPRQVINVDAA
jgi:hypothetical protein